MSTPRPPFRSVPRPFGHVERLARERAARKRAAHDRATCGVCGLPIVPGNAVRAWFHEDGAPEDVPAHEATPKA